jgi:hypothetical protein
MSWQIRALAGDTVANLHANAARSLIVFGAFAVVFGGLAFLEVHQANGLLSFEADYQAAGGYLAVVSAQGGISASRCEQLNAKPGVIAAGGSRGEGQATFTMAPGVLYQQYAVTEDLLRVWDPRYQSAKLSGGGIFLSGRALADELALRPGTFLARVGEPPATLAAVLDVNRRAPQSDRSLLEVIPPTGLVDDCWVEFTPQAYSGGVDALAAAFASSDSDPTVRPFTSEGEFTRNPAHELATRPQRNGWIIAAALLIGVLVLTAWFRRADLGLYLALGTPRSLLVLMLAIETWALAVAAWVGGVLWALAIERATGHGLTLGGVHLAVITSGSAALAVVILGPLLASLVARGNIAALLKDR